jgi:hypothetical protein
MGPSLYLFFLSSFRATYLQVPIVVHSADAPELKMGEEFERDPLQLTYVAADPLLFVCSLSLVHAPPYATTIGRFHRHYYALGEHYNSVVAGELEE